MLRFLCLIPCVALIARATPLGDSFVLEQWKTFKVQYNKEYFNDTEEKQRMAIFHENIKLIETHNALYEKGEVTFKLKINQFSDMSQEEFNTRTIGYGTNNFKTMRPLSAPFIPKKNVALPNTVDWRTKNITTPVKQQGPWCYAGWAFSAIGSLEGQMALKTGVLESYSVQQLIDCSWDSGNYGCKGGTPWLALYYGYLYGIETEYTYPYMSDVFQSCQYVSSNVGALIRDYTYVKSNSQDLEAAVAVIGPISVGIDASSPTFIHYSSGLYTGDNCSEIDNHYVLVVGYGIDNGSKFWLIKNSWGTGWGEDGYMKLAREGKNVCGILNNPVFPYV